jgi:hypothetical protein
MRWLKHMTATWDDERIARLVDEGGDKGLALYGAYWRILEIVASKMDGPDPSCSCQYSVTRWSVLMSVRGSLLRHYLGHLVKCDLLSVEWIGTDVRVTIPKLLKYRDEYSRKSGHAAEKVPPRTDTDTEAEVEEKKKRSKPSAKGASPSHADDRFAKFRSVFERYFAHMTPGMQAPWDAKEAANLSRWLKANPIVTYEQWRRLLNNRARSDVPHAVRLSKWIGDSLTWLNNTTDKYGKAQGNGNGKQTYSSKADRAVEAGLEFLADLHGSGDIFDEASGVPASRTIEADPASVRGPVAVVLSR